jgi:hypothetical protein
VLPSGMVVRPVAAGAPTSAYKRRQAARKAGLASGVKRRQRSTCKRRPRARTGQEALALAYKQRGISRRDFDRFYELQHPFPVEAPDVAGWQWLRGRESAWKIVQALERWWRANGQHFAFTNAQLLVTAGRLGLTLSIRQLQRIRGLLAAYGVAAHVRRGGAEPGNRDFLRFERRWAGQKSCKCMSVMPPSGAGASPFGASLAPALPAKTKKTLSPPPSAADDVGRRFASPGTEESEQMGIGEDLPPAETRYATEDERRLAFLAMCEVNAPALLNDEKRQELAELRARLGGSGQGTARTDSIACEGERWSR